MNVMAVDDEHLALLDLQQAIESALPDSTIFCSSSSKDALIYAERNSVNIAFLDIEMNDINGIELAKRLKNINGKTNIIFVTGYSKYALDSYSVDASGYLLKPVSKEAILDALEHLRNPIETQSDKKIRIQTFGKFEIFSDNKPIIFGRDKAKEVLAYLVECNGTGVTKKELAAVLWDDGEYDRNRQKSLQVFVSEMMKSLKAVHADHIIIKGRDSLSVDKTAVDCDFYHYLDGELRAINMYMGQFMSQYSWAEFTNASLTMTKKGV